MFLAPHAPTVSCSQGFNCDKIRLAIYKKNTMVKAKFCQTPIFMKIS